MEHGMTFERMCKYIGDFFIKKLLMDIIVPIVIFHLRYYSTVRLKSKLSLQIGIHLLNFSLLIH